MAQVNTVVAGEYTAKGDMIGRSAGMVIIGVLAVVCGTWLYLNREPVIVLPKVPPVSSAVAAEGASSTTPSFGAPYTEPFPVRSPAESSEFFVKTMVCRDIPVMLSALRKNVNCGPALPDAESQAERASCLAEGSNVGDDIRKLEDQERGCSGFDVTPEAVFAATRAAADEGDVRAQHCFIGGMFTDPRQGKASLPQTDIDAYPALASKYIEESLARADWSTVVLLSQPPRMSSLLGANPYAVGTPETEYKMTRLLQLGANAKLAARLGHSLENLTQETAATLTPEAVASAEQWAQDEYAMHFAASVRLDAMPADGCTFPGDAMP